MAVVKSSILTGQHRDTRAARFRLASQPSLNASCPNPCGAARHHSGRNTSTKDTTLLTNLKAMVSLLDLPNELIVLVGEALPHPRDINNLLRTNRRISQLLGKVLLLQNIHHHGSSALLWAAEHNDLDLATYLIVLGADVETSPHTVYCSVPTPEGGVKNPELSDAKPLYFAVFQKNANMVRLLIDAGARVVHPRVGYLSPLQVALQGRSTDEITKLFIDGIHNVNYPLRSEGRQAIVEACLAGNVFAVERLLQRGADIHLGVPSFRGVLTRALLHWRKYPQLSSDARLEMLKASLKCGRATQNWARAILRRADDPRARGLIWKWLDTEIRGEMDTKEGGPVDKKNDDVASQTTVDPTRKPLHT
ncbi:hypothetical protein K458DRAFT_401501 [Lentithecium fluviatile CBS 122367]|uniref:Uncharacterized protein n=1 Tax=Lentithecium fluviatile CBS 122367 TaxID=1168545 RepID=A0A6G1JD99_9PLEO|nr:hypothetical protein K458DRAFT_401501 [Lentithecium fluviatile CBS 122367]